MTLENLDPSLIDTGMSACFRGSDLGGYTNDGKLSTFVETIKVVQRKGENNVPEILLN
jgi:hypothetical protein